MNTVNLSSMSACGPVDWIGTTQRLITEHGRAVLIMVTADKGSTPRDSGTWMLVSDDKQSGTLGGGELERLAEEAARAMLAGHGTWQRSSLHCALGPDLRQCCGGHVTLMLEPLDMSATDWLAQAAESARVADNQYSVLFQSNEPAATPRIITNDGALSGITGVHLQLLTDTRLSLFLFGAGHVGQAVATLSTQLPLRLTVIDGRANQRALIPNADNIEVMGMDSAEEAAARVSSGSAALVMTHSHELDYTLCHALLTQNSAVFVGLIGSRSKANRFRSRLRKDNVPEKSLARLTSPIGSSGPKGKEPGVIALAALSEVLTLNMKSATLDLTPSVQGANITPTAN
ncbi:MAG TPA: xanthine dehydrogenase accessory protein XdhC [Gammaproteobacteria bacterium]|jgi:xanthine dehydrogenase accessory factor|nr:xanthine dehydrogenase accessory protein XdhC [Gammaproteobacteria bacterium]